MYYGAPKQGAQRWHWGNAAPNSHSDVGDPVLDAKTTWTASQQRELYDAAWFILKGHGVNSDTTNYWLAMELVDKIASFRDGQRDE